MTAAHVTSIYRILQVGALSASGLCRPAIVATRDSAIEDEAKPITLETVKEALKLQGIELSDEDIADLVDGANANLENYEELREIEIPNDVSPPYHFSPIVPGMVIDREARPLTLSAAPPLARPGDLEEVAFWPATHLAALIESRQVTSVELTQMYLDRLHRYNPLLNNVVTFLDEHALAEAAAVDAEIAAGKYRGPLHGLPWGAKDIIALAGHPTTWGSAPFEDQVFDYDATVVELLREAGAVLIAKLTTGELAGGDNWFGGQTMNPWNPVRLGVRLVWLLLIADLILTSWCCAVAHARIIGELRWAGLGNGSGMRGVLNWYETKQRQAISQ
jgi:hypothetical protein